MQIDYTTPARFKRMLNSGKIDIAEGHKFLIRYAKIEKVESKEVLAGFITIRTFKFGKTVFEGRMKNGAVVSLSMYH